MSTMPVCSSNEESLASLSPASPARRAPRTPRTPRGGGSSGAAKTSAAKTRQGSTNHSVKCARLARLVHHQLLMAAIVEPKDYNPNKGGAADKNKTQRFSRERAGRIGQRGSNSYHGALALPLRARHAPPVLFWAPPSAFGCAFR